MSPYEECPSSSPDGWVAEVSFSCGHWGTSHLEALCHTSPLFAACCRCYHNTACVYLTHPPQSYGFCCFIFCYSDTFSGEKNVQHFVYPRTSQPKGDHQMTVTWSSKPPKPHSRGRGQSESCHKTNSIVKFSVLAEHTCSALDSCPKGFSSPVPQWQLLSIGMVAITGRKAATPTLVETFFLLQTIWMN